VINTAAFVRVDDCEQQMEKAFRINALAVKNIAQVCQELDSTLVHISTDYVFGGDQSTPYREDDPPNPLSVYASSKLAGEYFAANYCQKHQIIRSSGLFGTAGSMGKGGNFVETMIRLAEEGKQIRVVNDQFLSPTYTVDLANAIIDLVQTDLYGIFHITNRGGCSWYQFAESIFELIGVQADLEPIPTSQYPTPACRPGYSVLDNQKFANLGLDLLPHWQDALETYLKYRTL